VARPGGLGRGLEALIPTGVGGAGSGFEEIPVAAIRPNPLQPRRAFDEEALSALADSIREVGILQPVLVRRAGEHYELIAGERRWRAARRIGLTQIPALVRESDDAAALEQALVENVHRADLNPLEEAAAYQQLIEDFNLTHEEVATRVGRSRAAVTNTLRLLQLPAAVQRLVRDGALTMGHARALLGTPDRALQERLAQQAAAEGWSVRATEDAVRDAMAVDEPAPAGSQPHRRSANRQLRPPGLLELEELLGDHLETRVKVSMGGKRGRVVVEFSDLEDLERIYRIMIGAHRGVEGNRLSPVGGASQDPAPQV
jgi:ParB family chromosome partitioning protein